MPPGPRSWTPTAARWSRWRSAYGVEPGQPRPDDDDWPAKLEVIADTVPDAVSFTFGCPTAEVLARFAGLGVLTMVTVTSREEADYAVAAGADALMVQGPEAGGHRSVFAPGQRPGEIRLPELARPVRRCGGSACRRRGDR